MFNCFSNFQTFLEPCHQFCCLQVYTCFFNRIQKRGGSSTFDAYNFFFNYIIKFAIMQCFVEFLQNVYYHCMHYVVNKRLHWIERCFWFLWIVMSMIGIIFIVNQSISMYYLTKASLRVRTDYLDFVTPFPAIFFCEKRELNGKIDKMLKHLNFTVKSNQSVAEITGFVRSASFTTPGAASTIKTCDDPEREFCKFTLIYRENLPIFLKHVQASCEEIFTSCLFNGKNINCCKHLLPVDTLEGKCYGINSFNAIMANASNQYISPHKNTDKRFLIRSLLYKLLPFMLKHTPQENPANLSIELAHLYLHVWYIGNYNVPTKMYQKENLFDLSSITDNTTEIYLRVEEVVPDSSTFDLEIEKRNCRFWYENDNIKAMKIYSNSACEIECHRKNQLSHCKCVAHLLPNQNDLKDPICNATSMSCLTRLVEQKNTYCKCLSNCRLIDVFATGKVTFTDQTRFRHENSLKRVNIIARAPTIQHVRYAEEEILDFIVSIGGAITLFIGCSFLSLVQIFYYFLLKPFSESCLRYKRL